MNKHSHYLCIVLVHCASIIAMPNQNPTRPATITIVANPPAAASIPASYIVTQMTRVNWCSYSVLATGVQTAVLIPHDPSSPQYDNARLIQSGKDLEEKGWFYHTTITDDDDAEEFDLYLQIPNLEES